MTRAVRVLDSLEALMMGTDSRAFRVGLAMPFSGNLALNGPSVIEALHHAGCEINASRGRSERQLEFVLFDSNGPAPVAARTVAEIAASGVVEAFVGLHTSATLQCVERAVKAPLPYIFAPGHEADDRLPGYFCAGETPAQAIPGIDWLMNTHGIREWAMVGTDYVWPRAMRASLHPAIKARGGRVVLDVLVPLGQVRERIGDIVDTLMTGPAQGIIVNMSGRDVADVLLELRGRGLDDRLVRFSTTLEENVLYAIDGDFTGKLYSMLHSFSSLQSSRMRELNERHRAEFGDEAPVLTNWAEHAYDGLHLLAELEREGRLSAAELGTPGGTPLVAGHSVAYPSYLAVAAGLSFEVVASFA